MYVLSDSLRLFSNCAVTFYRQPCRSQIQPRDEKQLTKCKRSAEGDSNVSGRSITDLGDITEYMNFSSSVRGAEITHASWDL